MAQPIFGQHAFSAVPPPPPKDAFEVVTGEVLQGLRAAHPERRYLVDESVVVLSQQIHAAGKTEYKKLFDAEAYVGMWLVVRFALGDHVSRFGMEIVRPSTAFVGKDASLRLTCTCIFDSEPWGEKLATFPVGTVLTVAGPIEQLGEFEIRLRNCELV